MSKDSLPGNPHLTGANWNEMAAEPFAIAQAALALAYEQRTANLIAMLQPIRLGGGEEVVVEKPFADKILAQISERLGLETEADK